MRLLVRSVLLVMCLSTAGCLFSGSYLEGKVIGSNSLTGFAFWIILLEPNGTNHRHYVVLDEKNHYKIRVHEKGTYDVNLVVDRFPKAFWRSPRLTIANAPSLLIDTESSATQQLPDIYVNEPIEIYSPKEGDKIPVGGNFSFRWSSDRIVDFYYLTFYQKIKGGENKARLTVEGIRTNQIEMSEILHAKIIDGKFDYEKEKVSGITKRVSGELVPGEYKVAIAGVVDKPTEKNFLWITESKTEPIVHLF